MAEGFIEPPQKKAKLSLKLKKPLCEVQNTRFSSPISQEVLAEAAKGVVPANTKKCTSWAVKVFYSWMECRNVQVPQDLIPADILKSPDPHVLCKFLRCFVLEVRKEDGTMYPPSSIRSILGGLHRVLRENGATFSIFDKDDPIFREFALTLDTVTSQLHSEGIGAKRNKALVIPFEHEVIFWDKGIIGYGSPKSLMRAVFCGIGMHFVLRGVEEHRNLKIEQIERFPSDQSLYSSDTYYEYMEYISKNNIHRFKDINTTNKCVRAYAKPDNERCLVRLLDFYLSKLPPDPPAFYLRPLLNIPVSPDLPWYAKMPIGANTLKNVVPEISEEAGIGVRYTNHSLRATAITRMYDSGVPEKLIAEKSGHKSLKGLRAYEKTSTSQEKAAGDSITCEKSFNKTDMSDKKPVLLDGMKPMLPDQVVHNFSGLQGCTLNFYNNS
ncbi:PREDICTED: glutamine-rich protein 1-like [Amphimedon queenslandica]|nr:PREDICTED: glutamine-rich protein 1-like [Amphimedon queenslandica]|eukprot:XP_011407854.1 PREDICTED: glutamine-rich protein 1-like [Amphimedon queenslandica]